MNNNKKKKTKNFSHRIQKWWSKYLWISVYLFNSHNIWKNIPSFSLTLLSTLLLLFSSFRLSWSTQCKVVVFFELDGTTLNYFMLISFSTSKLKRKGKKKKNERRNLTKSVWDSWKEKEVHTVGGRIERKKKSRGNK